jgi:transcriptional regulator with XRE-family HTH domain
VANSLRIAEVVEEYLSSGGGMTHQQFADALTQSLVSTGISRVSVTNWANGKSEPSTDFLLQCVAAYGDWRRQFANDCLRIKLPETFDSGILKLPTAK